MSTILPFILFLGSLGTVILFVIKKYPQLTLLDVDNVTKVKEIKKKDEIVKKRADKQMGKTAEAMKQSLLPIVEKLSIVQHLFRGYTKKVKEKAYEGEDLPLEREIVEEAPVVASVPEKTVPKEEKKAERIARPRKKQAQEPVVEEVIEEPLLDEKTVKALEKKDKIKALYEEGMRLVESEEFAQAEKRFIDIICLDMKHKAAYQALGDVYVAQNQLEEAKETYIFITQLDKKDDKVYARLAQLAEKTGDISEAIQYLQQAIIINDSVPARFSHLGDLFYKIEEYPAALDAYVEANDLEESNISTLDRILELAIILSRKDVAEKTYKKMLLLDPHFKKLEKYKLKIDQL